MFWYPLHLIAVYPFLSLKKAVRYHLSLLIGLKKTAHLPVPACQPPWWAWDVQNPGWLCAFYWETQSWQQDSSCSVTGAKWRGRSTTLDLLAALLLGQPRMWLAVLKGHIASSCSSHCPPGSPGLFPVGLHSSQPVPTLYCCTRLFQPPLKILYFPPSWGFICPASLDPGFWPVDCFPSFGIVHRPAKNI